jgi:hypothetical protein
MNYITDDKELAETPYYKKICEVVERLNKAGILSRLDGQCVSSCDLIQNLLFQNNIESQIVEVQASVTRQNPGGDVPDYTFIGFDSLSFGGQVDTHTIVVTKTEIPILIDLSIAYALSPTHPYVVERLKSSSSDLLAEYDLKESKIAYQSKKIVRLPHLHQKTLLSRMIEDQRVEKNFRIISRIAVWALGVTIINFFINMFLVYLRFTLG